jgi:hypothetical protein
MSIRLQTALDQFARVRAYTLNLLGSVPEPDWFRMPTEGVSHIAWQVGHLAMAEYRLALVRTRGVQPGDDQLLSESHIKQFGINSVPDPDPAKNPTPAELRAALERVHVQAQKELPSLSDAELDQAPCLPHPLLKNKLDALLWLSQHEMLHAGQIGLLRRLLGHKPMW